MDHVLVGEFYRSAVAQPLYSVNDRTNCYIDYSLGMLEGIKATATINNRLKNFLLGKNVTYYKIGANDSPKEIEINSPEADFSIKSNFSDIGSKLKIAVDKMQADPGAESIFITDFERVENTELRQNLVGAPKPHPIDTKAWAQNDFRDWLEQGNQIDIFAKQFDKPDYWFAANYKNTYKNWIYTIVFTPRAIIHEPQRYQKSVVKYLGDVYDSLKNDSSARHFSYNLDQFRIQHALLKPVNADANELLILTDQFSDSPAFAYYEVTQKDLRKFLGSAKYPDKRVINKLGIAYAGRTLQHVRFSIKSYDITSAIDSFQTLGTAKGATAVNTQSVTVKKNVLPSLQEVNGLFGYLSPGYGQNLAGVTIDPSGIVPGTTKTYEINFIVASADLPDLDDAVNVMTLRYSQNYSINALGNSIYYALKSATADLAGKVVYTIYFRIDK